MRTWSKPNLCPAPLCLTATTSSVITLTVNILSLNNMWAVPRPAPSHIICMRYFQSIYLQSQLYIHQSTPVHWLDVAHLSWLLTAKKTQKEKNIQWPISRLGKETNPKIHRACPRRVAWASCCVSVAYLVRPPQGVNTHRERLKSGASCASVFTFCPTVFTYWFDRFRPYLLFYHG